MTAYVEYVILDNLVIDYLLLSAALVTARSKGKIWQLCLSSAGGTAFAVAMPFINFSPVLTFIVKIFVGEAMVLMAGNFKSVGQYVKAFLFFLLYTFAFGGALVGLSYLWAADFSSAEGLSNLYKISKVPFFAVFLSAFWGIKLIFNLVFGVRGERAVAPFEREVALMDGGECVVLSGLIDTGNTLYDKKSGKPVSVLQKEIADKLILSGKLKMRGARYLPCATIHGEGKILVFEIDRLVIYCGEARNIIDNAMVGISPAKNMCAEVILHAGLIGEL